MYRIGLICFASALFGAAQVLTQLRGAAASATDTSGVDFFEKRIRPLLAEHCYECHSAQSTKIKGGLLLDTREGLRKGGDTGPAIAAGDPDQSLLIKAVRYTDENLQMPPKNRKLSDDQIHDLEQWVRLGAPDPRGTIAVKPAAPAEKHWAFQPVRRPAPPSVRNQRWGQTPVDAFILAQLESRGLAPSRRADKRVLLRRATYDLTGLPPTEEEIAEFLADASEDAFTRVVDRLLGSPRYGERWARHWLDIARYADTKGYVFEEERRYPYAYTYRDYVIQAFNDDLPYDQFVLHQVAADALERGEDKRALAALGFLTLGRRFLNNPHDIIDDRIDVVSRGLLGLTVSCARCHDHKYDPIPTQDYYSWYGVFSSSSEPAEKPLLGTVTANPAYQQYLAERKKREHEYEDFRRTKETEALDQVRRSVADYLLVVRDAARQEDAAKIEGIARQRKLDPNVAGRWRDTVKKSAHQAVFAPWIALLDIPDPEFASRAAELAPGYSVNTNTALLLNRRVAALFQPAPPASAKELAEGYGKLFLEVHEQWQKLLTDATNAVVQVASTNAVIGAPREKPAPAALTDPEAEQLRQLLYGPESPTDLSAGEIMRLFDVPTAQKVRRLRRELEQLDATHPGAPARAMALQDNPTPRSARVFIRGNPNNPGPEVPRQFLSVLSRGPRRPFTRGSGRLELAQAIADANNPLTARVLVNRVWLQHFGAGIVRSPSDFGTRADPPSHPELLDYLAWRFMAEGWSIKKLHRLIMLSSVYQQTSDDHPASYRIDPLNQWLWRMNRRRLEFEAMRDTVLAVSGRLDLTVGGRPVEITTEPFPPRRTVYGFVERQNLPGLFRTFDFASPDTSSPQRFYTTIPQQALFMLNSPFLIDHSRALLQTSAVDDASHDRARIEALYRKSLQRTPTPDELRLASRFIERQQPLRPRAPAEDAWVYGYGTYDPAAERVTQFEPLPHFTGSAWQGGAKLPDPKLGWVMLNADGGHPGLGLTNVAIRRWIAPTAGTVRIKGDLAHDAKEGDGVRGRMLSSRAGKLGEWIVHQNKTEIAGQPVAVQAGDTLDFIVDCRAGIDSDSFHWTVVVDYERSLYDRAPAEQTVWSSKQDFSGPQKRVKPLDAWEKLAQVLLMSNELMFVD